MAEPSDAQCLPAPPSPPPCKYEEYGQIQKDESMVVPQAPAPRSNEARGPNDVSKRDENRERDGGRELDSGRRREHDPRSMSSPYRSDDHDDGEEEKEEEKEKEEEERYRRDEHRRSRHQHRHRYSSSRSRSRSVSTSRSRSRSWTRSRSRSRSRSASTSRSRSRSRRSSSRSRSRNRRYRSYSSRSPSRSPRSYRHHSYHRSRSWDRRGDYNDLIDNRFGRPEIPSSTLVIKGIPVSATEEDLRRRLREWEPPTSVRIIKDKYTGASRGFAFVEFSSVEVAQSAKTAFLDRGGLFFDGRPASVEFSKTAATGYGTRGCDWLCKNCDAINFARRSQCYKCLIPRPDDAILLDPELSTTFPKYNEAPSIPTISSSSSSSSSEPSSILIIKGMDDFINEEMLHCEISKHAPIMELKIVRDKYTQVSRGFSFVQFYSIEDATKVLSSIDGMSFDGSKSRIKVAFARGSTHSHYTNHRSNDLDQYPQFDSLGWTPKEYSEGGNTDTKDPFQQMQNTSMVNYASEIAAWSSAYGTQPQTLSKSASDLSKENLKKVQTPNAESEGQSGFIWDSSSGYYYNADSGLYYDGYREIYYDTKSQNWLKYDAEKSEYSIYSLPSENPPSSSSSSSSSSLSVMPVTNSTSLPNEKSTSYPTTSSISHSSLPSMVSSASTTSPAIRGKNTSSSVSSSSIVSSSQITRASTLYSDSKSSMVSSKSSSAAASQLSTEDTDGKKTSLAEAMAAAAATALKAEKKERLKEKEKDAKKKLQDQLSTWKQRQMQAPKSQIKNSDAFKKPSSTSSKPYLPSTIDHSLNAEKQGLSPFSTEVQSVGTRPSSGSGDVIGLGTAVQTVAQASSTPLVPAVRRSEGGSMGASPVTYQTDASALGGYNPSASVSKKRKFSEKPVAQPPAASPKEPSNPSHTAHEPNASQYRDRAAERRFLYQTVTAKEPEPKPYVGNPPSNFSNANNFDSNNFVGGSDMYAIYGNFQNQRPTFGKSSNLNPSRIPYSTMPQARNYYPPPSEFR